MVIFARALDNVEINTVITKLPGLFLLMRKKPFICVCISQPFITVTKHLTLKEERFILAHGFRSFGSWSLAPLLLGLWQGRNIMVS
jgi:hypothetical protein